MAYVIFISRRKWTARECESTKFLVNKEIFYLPIIFTVFTPKFLRKSLKKNVMLRTVHYFVLHNEIFPSNPEQKHTLAETSFGRACNHQNERFIDSRFSPHVYAFFLSRYLAIPSWAQLCNASRRTGGESWRIIFENSVIRALIPSLAHRRRPDARSRLSVVFPHRQAGVRHLTFPVNGLLNPCSRRMRAWLLNLGQTSAAVLLNKRCMMIMREFWVSLTKW